MANLLLSFGADINWIVDKESGLTKLMQLCMDNFCENPQKVALNIEMIIFLIERGADPYLKSFVDNKNAI